MSNNSSKAPNGEQNFFKLLEQKWVKKWDEEKTYSFVDDLNKPKFYILDMFPYPSGAGLHIGHVKGYLASDIIARYKKMKGFSVLHPMGWDAFGLPAEQYAIQNKADPSIFTEKNITKFREELKSLFFSYDFEKEINSTDPNYYAITQELFLLFYNRGLASLEAKQVNWVEELHTVLANEEIYQGKDGKFYSNRGDYPVINKKLKQWVLKITEFAHLLKKDLSLLEWSDRIKKIQEEWIGEKEAFKFSLKLKGRIFEHLEEDIDKLRAISGFYIYKNSEIFNLLELKHPVKDNEILFYYNDAQTLNKIPIKYREGENISEKELHPIYSDLVAKKRIPSFLNWEILSKVITFKLQDWVFSRQRYWGEPFPIYYDEEGHIFLEEKLPLVLPPYKNIENTDKKYHAPLAHYENWVNFQKGFKRDINTMPNWAASSWYYLAYLLKKGDSYLPLKSKEAIDLIERWMPVDLYIGGQEHATMHLIYARFWYKVIHSALNLKGISEPFKKLVNQGMILGEDGKKMSKSKNNYLSVEELLKEWGGDITRLAVAFLGPLELTQYWDNRQLSTFSAWNKKIYSYFLETKNKLIEKNLNNSKLNEFIEKVEYSINSFKFNVLVSELMIFFNYLKEKENKNRVEHSIFIQFLSYLAPSLAEEIWREILDNNESVYLSSWPSQEESKPPSFLNYSVQVNNKYKGSLQIPSELKEDEEIMAYLKGSELGQNLLKEVFLNKYIIVYGKIINLVIKPS
ncbi:class I tRNA ligase family protein [Mycoplasma parvum]|uniref:leucine--tRNA ligase n=1 Tax=Mycoplasma parvum str. Indiana TaxID=1403316 RepID=U5NCQ6_9MOLU|nr:class I tRNA ligase family protein [Mycoplasma parvum]AGX89212.1 leucyl-tRNA synthetase [Mycoplasma parvum str. Indiana]